MYEAVIVDSVRTPLAKSHRGSLNATRSDDMAAYCLRALLDRQPALQDADVDDVILGCGYPEGTQGRNIGRMAALRAGLATSVPGMTLNRFCSSGLQAIAVAAHQVTHEGSRVVLAGGVESITGLVDARRDKNLWLEEHVPGVYLTMGQTAEIVAKRYKINRQSQDDYSLESQKRTARAAELGYLAEEIVPMRVVRNIFDKKTQEIVGQEEVEFGRDECHRPDTTIEGLAKLSPVFDTESGEGSVTAGNSSQLSDGASATLVMARPFAESLGLEPLLIYRGMAVAGCDPDEMGIGPVFAVPKLLDRFGLRVSDIDLWELNEAFAVQVVYCRDFLEIDSSRLNVNGGSIALGHPFGMTGSRLVGVLARELRRRGGRFGVVTMCVGGGQGAAALFERPV
jgi:acetyl-CoA acetyltransferase family protein